MKKIAPVKTKLKKPAKVVEKVIKASKRKVSKNVRETLLGLLAVGPKTRPQLLKMSGCSPASLHNHIRDLRADGTVVTDDSNRILSLKSVSPSTSEPEVVSIVVETSSSKALMSASDSHLFSALESLSFRLTPVQRAREKLLVLDQLARTTPEPVAEILRAIFEDIAKQSETV